MLLGHLYASPDYVAHRSPSGRVGSTYVEGCRCGAVPMHNAPKVLPRDGEQSDSGRFARDPRH
jgi:hypothetical protein